MHKRYKDQQGKAVKWIDTRYAKPFKIRRVLKAAKFAVAVGVARAEINAIRACRATSIEGRAGKAFAIADRVHRLNEAALDIFEKK